MHRHFNTSSSSSQWLFHQLFFLNWGQHVCVFWAYAALSILSKLSAVHQRPRLLFSIWECNKTHFIISNFENQDTVIWYVIFTQNEDIILTKLTIPIAFHTLSRMGDHFLCHLLAPAADSPVAQCRPVSWSRGRPAPSSISASREEVAWLYSIPSSK